MTLQLPAVERLSVETHSDTRWMSPAAGLWVASRRVGADDTEHAGMVELLDDRYHARSARGRALGSFEDLDSARAAIGGEGDDPLGAPRGVRALLWVMIGSAAGSAFALALAFLR